MRAKLFLQLIFQIPFSSNASLGSTQRNVEVNVFGNNSPANSKADFLVLIHITAGSGLHDAKSQFSKSHSTGGIHCIMSQCML